MKVYIGSRLQQLRKEKGISQEELADLLGVSRQSVSKWELDTAYPETEKLIKLAQFYQITLDSLINPDHKEYESHVIKPTYDRFRYEYKSNKKLFGLPLIHVNIGNGLYRAKGVFAIGMISKGFVSLGLLSFGLFSLGVGSIGLISLGVFTLGLLLAMGSVAIGMIAIGAIAIGLFSIGAVSIGYFSIGALSIAKYVAIGDHAYGLIAVGETKVSGTYSFIPPYDVQDINQLIDTKVPSYWKVFKELVKLLIKT